MKNERNETKAKRSLALISAPGSALIYRSATVRGPRIYDDVGERTAATDGRGGRRSRVQRAGFTGSERRAITDTADDQTPQTSLFGLRTERADFRQATSCVDDFIFIPQRVTVTEVSNPSINSFCCKRSHDLTVLLSVCP